jgi:hypothetical protein
MATTIDFASIFNQELANKFAITLRTAPLEDNTLGIRWDGGKYINVPSITMQGLGTVQGCIAPDGEYAFDFEPFELQWYRGRTFSIPRYAVNETNFTLNVGNMLNSFVEQHVIPETDKLRIGTAADKAISHTGGDCVTYEGASASATPLADLIADIGLLQDRVGEDKRIYCFISTKKKTAIMKSSELSKYLSVRELERNGANVKVEALNDVPLIGVPSSYMHTKWKLNDGTTSGQEAGGVTPDTGDRTLNWLLVTEGSAIAIGYPRIDKIITPDQNQDGNCWKMIFTDYHGLIVPKERVVGLHANVAGTES